MSFINDIAFDERVDELEVEGHLRVGGDILLHGEFPKMDQQIASLNSSISLKANPNHPFVYSKIVSGVDTFHLDPKIIPS